MEGKSCNAGLIAIITTIIFAGGIANKTIPLTVSDSELKQLTEELFSSENPDLQNGVQIDLQGRISRTLYRDMAPEPLITVDPSVLQTPVIRSFRELFDNYEPNTLEAEDVTSEERDEENNFVEALLNTTAVDRVMRFLSEKGYIGAGNRNYEQILRNVWFTQYARKRKSNVLGSSGFEHGFVGEMKGGRKFMGLHNWISFNAKEASGELDYWGYKNSKSLGNNTSNHKLIYATYSHAGNSKSSSFFIGTSPELEISLYTLCYFVRPDRVCRISLGGTKIVLQTYILDHKKQGVEPSLGSFFVIL